MEGSDMQDPLSGESQDIVELKKRQLRELFPEVFSEDRIDFDKLKATLGQEVDLGERYGLTWKGKSKVFAKIQEKTVATLHPQPEESVDWDTTQNMFIEGDNLEALKVLHKAYYGKIKMIYIDPPYNTGNDFVYNDDFKKTRREQALEDGTIDEEGNITRDDGLRVNTGGHKHSNWLDMMYPRLFLARNLLRQDGVIFVSIDDNEVHNLRLMMNEIFGEENFVGQFVWRKKTGGGQADEQFVTEHEYVVCFSRSPSFSWSDKEVSVEVSEYKLEDEYGNFKITKLAKWGNTARREDRPSMYYALRAPNGGEAFPVAPDGGEGRWRVGKQKMDELLAQNLVFWRQGKQGWVPYEKEYYIEGKTKRIKSRSILYDIASTGDGSNVLTGLFEKKDIFENPKPVELLDFFIANNLKNDEVALDFFGGSGTLAHAISQRNALDGLNRRWITVQLPELANEKSVAYKAGYETISNISRERIRRVGIKISKDSANEIAKRETSLDLGFRSYVLGDSNFKKWNELMSDPDEIRQATLDSLNPLEDGVKDDDLLTEILLKRGISPLVGTEVHDDFVFVHPKTSLSVSRVT